MFEKKCQSCYYIYIYIYIFFLFKKTYVLYMFEKKCGYYHLKKNDKSHWKRYMYVGKSTQISWRVGLDPSITSTTLLLRFEKLSHRGFHISLYSSI